MNSSVFDSAFESVCSAKDIIKKEVQTKEKDFSRIVVSRIPDSQQLITISNPTTPNETTSESVGESNLSKFEEFMKSSRRKGAIDSFLGNSSEFISKLVNGNFNQQFKIVKDLGKSFGLNISDDVLKTQLLELRHTKILGNADVFKYISQKGVQLGFIASVVGLWDHISEVIKLGPIKSEADVRKFFKECTEFGFEVFTMIGTAAAPPFIIADIFTRMVFDKSFIETGMAIGDYGGEKMDSLVNYLGEKSGLKDGILKIKELLKGKDIKDYFPIIDNPEQGKKYV